MKGILSASTFLCLTFFMICSCRHRDTDGTAHKINDTVYYNLTSYQIDSVRLRKVLEEAVETSKRNLQKDSFYHEFETTPDDSSYSLTVNITMGPLFSNTDKYVLIRRRAPSVVYLDLFQVKNNDLKPVLYREEGPMTYIGDTIQDVNGDGLKDFVVHWYPSSGCCLRNTYNVYLNQANDEAFTREYQFINPLFSPEEKIVRGIGYGHPGLVGLFKYKWNGLQIDTIEFIYPDPSCKINRCFFRLTEPPYDLRNPKREKIKGVPKEYLKIESFEWFIAY